MNRPLADKHSYRGIEFRVDEVGQGRYRDPSTQWPGG